MVFLAAGIQVRHKRIIAYHFMGKSIDPFIFRDFLIELIVDFERITLCKCVGLVLDLGPHNCSLINAFGLSLKIGSTETSIQHPCDTNRRLFLIPDNVHADKCFASSFRRGSITIPSKFVKKYNLSTSASSMNDVTKLLNLQKKMIYKPAKNLKDAVVKPNHFEAMREKTSRELFDTEVSSSIQFLNQSRANSEKLSATVFLLRFFDRWSRIMNCSVYSPNDMKKFEDDKNFLLEFCKIVDGLKFQKSRLKSQTGSIWSTIAFIEITRNQFNEGAHEIRSSRFSQNALENIFSIVDSGSIKQSCLRFKQSLRTLSVTQFNWNPVKCFLELISETNFDSDEQDEEIYLQVDFEIPSNIASTDLFPNILEANAFHIKICRFFNKTLQSVKCEQCVSSILTNIIEENKENSLKNLRLDDSSDIFVDVERKNVFKTYLIGA